MDIFSALAIALSGTIVGAGLSFGSQILLDSSAHKRAYLEDRQIEAS